MRPTALALTDVNGDAKTDSANDEDDVLVDGDVVVDVDVDDDTTEEASTGKRSKSNRDTSSARSRAEKVAAAKEKARAAREESAKTASKDASKDSARESDAKAHADARAIGVVLVDVPGSWAHVYEGKRKLGETPIRLELTVGKHKLRLKNPETGREKIVTVEVDSGKPIRVNEKL